MWNVKMLTGEQWRAPVGQRVLLAPNPDNQPDPKTSGPTLGAGQDADAWRRHQDSKPSVNEYTVAEIAPSLRFVKLHSSNHCGNSWYRRDEVFVMEAVGKAGPIKKPKGDDPRAPKYGTL